MTAGISLIQEKPALIERRYNCSPEFSKELGILIHTPDLRAGISDEIYGLRIVPHVNVRPSVFKLDIIEIVPVRIRRRRHASLDRPLKFGDTSGELRVQRHHGIVPGLEPNSVELSSWSRIHFLMSFPSLVERSWSKSTVLDKKIQRNARLRPVF